MDFEEVEKQYKLYKQYLLPFITLLNDHIEYELEEWSNNDGEYYHLSLKEYIEYSHLPTE